MTTHTSNRAFMVQDAVSLTNGNLVLITRDAICPVLRISQFGLIYTISVWMFGAQVEMTAAWNDLVYLVDDAEFDRLMKRHAQEAQ